MSDYDRNNRYNLNYERELQRRQQQESFRKNVDENEPRVNQDANQQQVPKPEPRRKLMHTFVRDEPNLKDELAMDNQHVARLVTIKHHHHEYQVDHPHVERRSRVDVNIANVDQSSHDNTCQPTQNTLLQDIPTEFMSDEGVSSPTTHHSAYDEEDDDDRTSDKLVGNVQKRADGEYYQEDEDEEEEVDFEPPSQQRVPGPDDLEALSRQSLVPIHELIAYYQYIQHGDQHQQQQSSNTGSAATSRQSSSASQQTTRTEQSDDILMQSDEFDHKRAIESKRTPSQQSSSFDNRNDLTCQPTNRRKIEQCFGPMIVVDSADQEKGGRVLQDEIDHEEQTSSPDNEGDEDETQQQEPDPAKVQERLRLRANVIAELINSERDYVKHLKDVVDGYLHRARKHVEIFTSQRINTIFANIESLYEFQKKFLEDLEQCIDRNDLAQSEVGDCFLKYEKGFSIYHYYCNNHPNATSELQELYSKPIFRAFFEECRLKQNMIDISLDGFLLTPIQRICKYPLQLNELLKNTESNHPDYQDVLTALDTMRNCANLANERKRRIEALADLMLFQEKFDNWFGPRLNETSSILIHSGEVSKMTSHTWSQGVQLYLFDHLLLYSKKDLLKRNNLILKGRICMDTVTEISDAAEYKSRKSFKLYCSEQQKWFVFTTKSEKEKDEWIQAFERERNLVEADESEGFHITDRELGIARRTLLHRKRSRSARFRSKRPDTAVVDQLELDDPNMIINRTLSLPSCIHPSHVMNFVEDPRASGSAARAKKDSSPGGSNSRSPMASTMQLADHHQDHQPTTNQSSGPGNWLRKMGSKKLTKSQVYNINGGGGHTGNIQQRISKTKSQIHPIATESTRQQQQQQNSLITSTSSHNIGSVLSNSDAAALKYEELEKRYRDHMVGEEQARLYRLNNDLPPTANLYARTVTPTPPHLESISGQAAIAADGILSIAPLHQPPKRQSTRTNTALISSQHQQDQLNSDFRTMNIRDHHEQQVEPAQGSTFEAELVLSSGRVVRVREDAV